MQMGGSLAPNSLLLIAVVVPFAFQVEAGSAVGKTGNEIKPGTKQTK